MSIYDSDFAGFLAEELAKYKDICVPVKCNPVECMLVHSAKLTDLHPNPDDEFCDPNIGPSYKIISEYESKYREREFQDLKYYEGDDPLMVEKMHPSGYMIVNGHHRWAAAIMANKKTIPIEIINTIRAEDVMDMINHASGKKRVTLDLDEVVFRFENDSLTEPEDEKDLLSGFFKERLRLGIPMLLHFLKSEGYDIWVYSANFYSLDYIRMLFSRNGVTLDGIVTGTGRDSIISKFDRKRLEGMLSEKYDTTLHIDLDMILRTFKDSKNFEEYKLDGQSSSWAEEARRFIKEFENE